MFVCVLLKELRLLWSAAVWGLRTSLHPLVTRDFSISRELTQPHEKNLKFHWIFVIHCWKKCRIRRINQWEVSPFIIVSSYTRPHFHFTMARGLLNTFWDPLIEIYDCNIFLLYILRHLDVLTAVYWHNIPLASSNCCRTCS